MCKMHKEVLCRKHRCPINICRNNSTSLVTMQIKIKTRMRYHFAPILLAKIKEFDWVLKSLWAQQDSGSLLVWVKTGPPPWNMPWQYITAHHGILHLSQYIIVYHSTSQYITHVTTYDVTSQYITHVTISWYNMVYQSISQCHYRFGGCTE